MANPAKLLRLKKEWDAFNQRHPKFVRYLSVVKDSYLEENAVIDMTVTNAEGKGLHANVRLTAEDLEMIQALLS